MTREALPGTDVTIERDVAAEMRDGTVLRADVYRPATSDPSPVLLARSPYGKTVNVSTFGSAHPIWLAQSGYVVIVQDTRGRYTSEGDFYPFLNEMEDGYDTVEWAARLPGADGTVGMFGFSYVGATQLLAAVTRPPSLASIAPSFTASQYYDGWTYNSGALATAFVCYWANLLALETAIRRDDASEVDSLLTSLGNAPSWYWSLPLSEYQPLKGGDAPYFYDWIEHHTYDDYWKRWSIDEDYGRIEVPALHVGGWYDVFLSGTVKNFNGLRSGGGTDHSRNSQKLVLGPWTHMPWTPVGRGGFAGPSTNDIDDWMVRWFDQTLKGADTGVLDHAVTIFTLDGEWLDYDEWPPEDVVVQRWYIHSNGRANSKYGDGRLDREPPGDEPADIFVYDPGVPIPSLGGHSCCFDTITPMGPADQHAAEVSRMMLVYTSDPLAATVDVIGDVSVTLYAASSAPDTDFTVRLCAVDPDGRSVNLQEGILRTRYRNSLSEPEMMDPFEVYRLDIELGPVGARITAASRIRLDISSSDFPQWDRNLNTGGTPLHETVMAAQPATQTVLHSAVQATCLNLPVRS